jgi:hypothetical protein
MPTLDPGVTGKRRPIAARKQATKTKKTLEPPTDSPFMTIQAAGKRFFGLSKNGSYDAAARGDFGKIYVVGRRKFVVASAIEARVKATSAAFEAAE